MPADLHLHTNFSDGVFSPEEIVKKAKQCGLDCIAITDHDTVDGIDRAILEGKKLGVEVIPGIEFSSDINDTEIHILGYFIDHKAAWFLELLKKMREDRVSRVGKIVEKLSAMGVTITKQDVLKFSDDGSIGRPHVARALVEKGYVKTIQEAFNKYLDNKSRAYVPHFKLTPQQAVETVVKAGGIPVFAHPAVSNMDAVIPDLVKSGLKGIEVHYSKHASYQIKHYLKLAKQYGLLVTGGSDFHGTGNPEMVGAGTLTDDDMKKLKAAHNVR